MQEQSVNYESIFDKEYPELVIETKSKDDAGLILYKQPQSLPRYEAALSKHPSPQRGGTPAPVFKTEKGHYQIFFKAPNEANMTAAFQKFTAVKVKKAERRKSVLGKLEKFKALVKNAVTDRTRRKELER